jgi:hypothetical protein
VNRVPDYFRYTLVDPDVPFSVDISSGEVSVNLAQGREIDCEEDPSFTIIIAASDGFCESKSTAELI